MIAGASGNLKRAVLLASVTCVAYGAFEFGSYVLFQTQGTEQLGTILLRVQFFLALTAYYGDMGVFAQKERKARETHEQYEQENLRIFTSYVRDRIVEALIKDPG